MQAKRTCQIPPFCNHLFMFSSSDDVAQSSDWLAIRQCVEPLTLNLRNSHGKHFGDIGTLCVEPPASQCVNRVSKHAHHALYAACLTRCNEIMVPKFVHHGTMCIQNDILTLIADDFWGQMPSIATLWRHASHECVEICWNILQSCRLAGWTSWHLSNMAPHGPIVCPIMTMHSYHIIVGN